ncbi:hypothetical protein JOB18_000230 [Solea senegalensis]|uniref:Uncharacterized protein n=1 Tax=Solea senegalensis TaxID=28829 RepID=A0AAV6RR50_SOLSE|nr:hypothetical protein JOB18_000230 [Solea senegalensis]
MGDHATDDVDMTVASSRNTDRLEKQLGKLQAQVASLTASVRSGKSQMSAKPSKRLEFKPAGYTKQTPAQPSQRGKLKRAKKPRPGYCFKCGEDGHIAPSCTNTPNPELVKAKSKQLKQKQQAWKELNIKVIHVSRMGLPETEIKPEFPNSSVISSLTQTPTHSYRAQRQFEHARRETQALVNFQTTGPMEMACIDYLSLEPDSHNTKGILVITDCFTKYAVAVPTRNQKAKTVAKCLWEHFFMHYGFPKHLHSDHGKYFESQVIEELCDLFGIIKLGTSPYHPRGDQAVRFNQSLLDMLETLQDKQKRHWRDYVNPITHAYNCTRNKHTGFSPYEMMFGCQPRLPLGFGFYLPAKDGVPQFHSQYVKNLRACLEESYQIATGDEQKVATKNKQAYTPWSWNEEEEAGEVESEGRRAEKEAGGAERAKSEAEDEESEAEDEESEAEDEHRAEEEESEAEEDESNVEQRRKNRKQRWTNTEQRRKNRKQRRTNTEQRRKNRRQRRMNVEQRRTNKKRRKNWKQRRGK